MTVILKLETIGKRPMIYLFAWCKLQLRLRSVETIQTVVLRQYYYKKNSENNTTTQRSLRLTTLVCDLLKLIETWRIFEFGVYSVWPIGGYLVLVLVLVCIEELESLKRIWRLIMTRSIPDSVEYGGRRMSKTKMVYDDISNVCVCVYAYYFTI